MMFNRRLKIAVLIDTCCNECGAGPRCNEIGTGARNGGAGLHADALVRCVVFGCNEGVVRLVNEHGAFSVGAENAIEADCKSIKRFDGCGIVNDEVVAVVIACMHIIALANQGETTDCFQDWRSGDTDER